MREKAKKCIKCSRQAIYFRRYSGEYLCERCFKDSIVERVRKTISKYKMLKYGDRIAVAVSGGKDSLSLLQILTKLSKKYGSNMFAVTVDEGIKGYRDEALKFVKEMTEKLNVKLEVVSFEELFGFTLDKAIKERKFPITSCTLCGVLRRRAIDIGAEKVNANVVATAHNLDDMVQTFFMNLIIGDLGRIKLLDPLTEPKNKFPIKRIRPFMEIYEEEIALYAYLSNIPFQVSICPYRGESIRSEFREILNNLEDRHSGVKFNILNTSIKLARSLQVEKVSLTCKKCGRPSSHKLCSVCKILDRLEIEVLKSKLT